MAELEEASAEQSLPDQSSEVSYFITLWQFLIILIARTTVHFYLLHQWLPCISVISLLVGFVVS